MILLKVIIFFILVFIAIRLLVRWIVKNNVQFHINYRRMFLSVIPFVFQILRYIFRSKGLMLIATWVLSKTLRLIPLLTKMLLYFKGWKK